MHDDLSTLTIDEMLYLKDELNQAYEGLIEQQNDWLRMCRALHEEMETRSVELALLEKEAKKDREAEYTHMYEAQNNLH